MEDVSRVDLTIMDDKALLAAILDDPDDDLPRLALADWLDEHGDDDRAEFIRGQVELSRTPPTEDRHAQLLARGRALEERHRAKWLSRATDGMLVSEFERGFPRRVGVPFSGLPRRSLLPQDFTALADAMGLFPLRVFSERLLGAVSPTIQRFPRQSVFPERGHSPLEQLAAWPHLARFTELDIGGGRILVGHGDFQPGVEALADSRFAANLHTLRLSGLLLGEDAVVSLAESPHLTKLRSLDVRYNVPLQDRPAALLETNLADRLEEIDGVDLDTAAAWLRRPGCRLRALGITLDPRNDHPDFADAGPLIGAPGLTELRRLSLHFDGPAAWEDREPNPLETIRVHNLVELLASPQLARLEVLALCGVELAGDQLERFLGGAATRNLYALALQRGRLAGVGPFRPLLIEGRLRRLGLPYNFLTNADAEALAGWKELSRLHDLRLDFNTINEDGAAAILGSRYCQGWMYLSV